jgi:hypothetical protein
MLRHAVDRPAITCRFVFGDRAVAAPPVKVMAAAERLVNRASASSGRV